jgi:glycosyltransferase involved in cell wall biosynthesis
MTAVSVCIASYNHARYLSRCLDSILAQTFQDYKIVVVDDGSQDHSLEILDEYQKRFPEKIRFYCHPGNSNRGISYTTNTTIRLSDGEYIATIGSDDLWYPEKLELQVALLEQHPEFGYVYSYADFIDQDDHPLPGRYGVDITQDPNPVGQMILSCHQPAMTVLFRRDFLNKIEWFDETLIYSDWDLMLRMTALWPAGFTDRPLAKYRIHGKNISKHIDPKVDLQRILDFTQAVQRNSTGIGGRLIDPRNLALLNLQLAFFHFCLPNKQEAIKYIRLAFEVDETLGQDIRYINGWLSGWKPEFYTTENDCFGLWFIHHYQKV